MIFSSKSVAQMQHSRNKHTTNHDKNSLNFFTTPLEFTTDPPKAPAQQSLEPTRKLRERERERERRREKAHITKKRDNQSVISFSCSGTRD